MRQKYIVRVYGTLYLYILPQNGNTFRLTRDIESAKMFDTWDDAQMVKESMVALAKTKGECPLPLIEIVTFC